MSATTYFLLREAHRDDEDAIFDLARHLNTLNLPPERSYIEDLLARSSTSFGGGPAFDPDRRLLFVLEAPDGRVVGTCMIHAQHGTYDDPHVYFSVSTEERHAKLTFPDGRVQHIHMEHTMLHLGMTYHGPTELGGLVLDPALRRHPQRLGRLLSLSRFVFIATHRGWFRDRLLAELLPPLFKGPEGATRSPLWDALGHRFTGLSYDEADRLSRFDKTFIWSLFPRMPIHASLLPEEVQAVIGAVGPNTVGALRLLESVGFSYVGRVDPFDGGPHVEAPTDQVTLVRGTRSYRTRPGDPGPSALPAIVAVLDETFPRFRAVWTHVALDPEQPDTLVAEPAALERLAHGRPGAAATVHAALRPGRRDDDRRPSTLV
ncbi:MAG: arginine N-succinyltransferase [Deltaproteobacteria bacterium]|nr:MAG: arginine N-succinyltransferase [Deltaproteobacteria bacterium]